MKMKARTHTSNQFRCRTDTNWHKDFVSLVGRGMALAGCRALRTGLWGLLLHLWRHTFDIMMSHQDVARGWRSQELGGSAALIAGSSSCHHHGLGAAQSAIKLMDMTNWDSLLSVEPRVKRSLGLEEKTDKNKSLVFLHVGEETLDIYNNFGFAGGENIFQNISL